MSPVKLVSIKSQKGATLAEQKNELNMIIRVKTTWQGKVGLHEKYINPYLDLALVGNLRNLEIKIGDEIMTIDKKEVAEKIVGKTDHPFQDRFSMETYNLYYFNWVPDPKPATLFD